MQQPPIEKLQELSDKWLKGTITAEELEVLEEWYNQEPQGNINWEAGDEDEEQLKNRLLYNINEVKKADVPVRRLISKTILYRVAAMVIAALGVTLYYTAIIKPRPGTIAKSTLKLTKAEIPNANKAVLTLANGSTVVLDDADNGLIAKQGNTLIHKTQEGKLTYNNDKEAALAEPEINTISTLKGGKYQITLPDGSKVWLNALTSLKFPTAFKGRERVVELTGEAYFEVAKDKSMPFKVKLADNTSIEVLGTHFNIMAYANESSINATLLEGSINVQKGQLQKIMLPGQEARIDERISLRQVDAEESISWINGLFSFEKSDIGTVMRQIERWYNVDVVYTGKMPENKITGYISRSSNLSEVIKMLKLSGLKIEIEGNKIKVFNDLTN